MPGGAPLGNKNGAKANRMIGDALRRAAAQNPDKLKKACEHFINQAAEGDLAAFKEIADRLDGRPAQSVIVGEDQENPFNKPESQRPKLSKDEWLKEHGIKSA